MRIYLDNCSLQRPLDDQTQPRIRVETEAVLAILAAVQGGSVVLISSEALEFEIGRIPDEQRRKETAAVLVLAKERIELTDEVQAAAESLQRQGVSPMDAIHLALASETKADYFVTSDDKLLKRAQSMSGLGCKVLSVLGLVPEVMK
jgi:predicted nucleic acid-binding protein